jgi:flagellar assembly factor FliW
MVMATRFGEITVDPAHAIEMPRGLLGFADHRQYVLAPLPDPRFAQFKLLQSLSDPEVSFLVLPIDPATGVLEAVDCDAACSALTIPAEDVVILVIVTIRRIAAEARVSVNLRAPIFVDVGRRRGWQFVMPNGRYPIRQELPLIGVQATR